MAALFNPVYRRINRLQWWLYQLVILFGAIATLILTALLFGDPDAPKGSRNGLEILGIATACLFFIYANFCTCLNRLRDSGRSWIWYLTFLLPTVGTGLMIYFCGIERSDFTANRNVPPNMQKKQLSPRTNLTPIHPRGGEPQFGRRNTAV
ncbi:DUF805 domain-containing protein [Roseibium sp. SCP14]|uniref:DUF805 domain-containing protein n=1 Tax=Roseibium sp. SCP14 TaxID=3141375 RepID=UPI00333D8BEE